MSFGELCRHVMEAASDVGPWSSEAEHHAWASYLHATDRKDIAEAISARFGVELQSPIAVDDQQWWLHTHGAAGASPLFEDHDYVYENGELSWRALRSYGPTPDELLDSDIPDMSPPLTRWTLPVKHEPRVFEIHRPSDWHDLCLQYPTQAKRRHGSWAFGKRSRLLELPQQHAFTADIDVHLCPNWSLIAHDYEAVHLSWAGFITTEAYVYEKGPNTTLLRYWEREMTMWLADCFGTPAPIPLPFECDYLIDVSTSPKREAEDRQSISEMLNRSQQAQVRWRYAEPRTKIAGCKSVR